MIGLISTLIVSFIIGIYGVIKNSNGHRVYAWVIVISCSPMIFLIAFLVNYQDVINQVLNVTIINTSSLVDQNWVLSVLSTPILDTSQYPNVATAIIYPIVIVVIDTYLIVKATKWLENSFRSRRLIVKNSFRRRWFTLLLFLPVMIIAISIIISALFFLRFIGAL
jgi:hypothetical protein